VELRNGLNEAHERPELDDSNQIAVGFDTNAIYRLGLGKKGPDAIDYLRTRHNGPTIVPGQAIQEIWNNVLAGVEPQARSLRKSFEAFQQQVKAIDQRLGETGRKVEEAVAELLAAHGDWIDPASQEVLSDTLEVLAAGTCAYVPRAEFSAIARLRHETKTPPGFRDDASNHGDFFVWADFLYSLALADTSNVPGTVFVTNDTKLDWSRNGVPHPVLVAEAVAVAGVPFRLWNLSEFHRFVSRLEG